MLDISIIDTNNMDALTNRLNIGQEKMKWKSHFDNHLIAKEVFNMKYKFELWNYDFFAYEEAERHLNDMSERGWDIVGITLESVSYTHLDVYKRQAQGLRQWLNHCSPCELGYLSAGEESGIPSVAVKCVDINTILSDVLGTNDTLCTIFLIALISS